MAGFDTVTAALSFLCYNLACNQDKQEKLYQEIVDVLGDKVKHISQYVIVRIEIQ